MKPFLWNSLFETGLDLIDGQHQQLVEIINRFSTLLASNDVCANHVEELYKQLADYAVYHFQGEEKMMSENNIDPRHLQAHIQGHNNFIEDIKSIYSSLSLQDSEQAKTFLNFLTHWLVYHVLGADQEMAEQIRLINAGHSPASAFEQTKRNESSATEALLNALDGLFEQVSIRNRELKQLNESLEQKVVQRTQELHLANKHLEELSLTDMLTGLPNRRHGMRSLSSFWQESLDTGSPMCCLMVDADHFKGINDSFGHDAGDTVLVTLSNTLQHSIRSDDVVCRLGGDEFLIICPNTNQEGGMHIANILLTAVSHLKVAAGDGFWFGSVSIGVAERTAKMQHFEDLIKAADRAVYEAKHAGKNCVKTLV